jgi:hypothetical protein
MRALIVLILACGLGAADLRGVEKVYLMPMAAGLDQHLANQLARSGFTVVVDPKQATAVWTERIDKAFFESLNELFPPAQAEKARKKDESLEGGDKPPARGVWGRTRGTIFLVDVATRRVLWSTFLPIEDTSPQGLHRVAQEIVKRVKKG